jgi:hypothetical protein
LRVAVCEGDLDLDRAAKIAKRMNKGKGIKIFPEDANSRTIEKAEDVLQHLFRKQNLPL